MTRRQNRSLLDDAGESTREAFLIIRHDENGTWLDTRTVTMRTYSDDQRVNLARFGEGYSGRVIDARATLEGDVVTYVKLIDPATRP